jgi:hypothetical protein
MDAELEARARAIERQRANIERAQTFLQGCNGCRQRPVQAVYDACDMVLKARFDPTSNRSRRRDFEKDNGTGGAPSQSARNGPPVQGSPRSSILCPQMRSLGHPWDTC